MAYEYSQRQVTDEDRRELLKAIGVAGAASLGGLTLEELHKQSSAGAATSELAPIGQAIKSDLAGQLDAGLIAGQQMAMAEATQALPAVLERGIPTESAGSEFAAIEAAGRPVYEHYKETGFFESTTNHLPRFEPSYLETAIQGFVASEVLSEPLQTLGFEAGAGVDLLSTVVANGQQLSDHHWVATDEIAREQIEIGELIPPMTMGAAGGALLWLEDLDGHLWRHSAILTEDILEGAVWHGQSMAAGFHLMNEGAKAIANEEASLSDGELGALLSTGFAIQAIAQGLLPLDVYWITDEMRDEPGHELATITE